MPDKKTSTRRRGRSRDLEQEAKQTPAESGPDDQEEQLTPDPEPATGQPEGAPGQSDLEDMRGGYPNPEFERYDRAAASDLLETGNNDGEGENFLDDVQSAPLETSGDDPNLALVERDDPATWAAVREEVRDSLAEEGLLSRGEIEVSGEDGHIVLSGQVQSAIERETAQTRAEAVAGVRRVENRLMVTTPDASGGHDAQ